MSVTSVVAAAAAGAAVQVALGALLSRTRLSETSKKTVNFVLLVVVAVAAFTAGKAMSEAALNEPGFPGNSVPLDDVLAEQVPVAPRGSASEEKQ